MHSGAPETSSLTISVNSPVKSTTEVEAFGDGHEEEDNGLETVRGIFVPRRAKKLSLASSSSFVNGMTSLDSNQVHFEGEKWAIAAKSSLLASGK